MPLPEPSTPVFTPRRGLRGGHAQTLAGHFLRRRNALLRPEERLVCVEEEVQILCHCHWQADRQRVVTLVLVHGLEGSSESSYVIGTGSKAWLAGMNVVRMNVRNCGGTERLAPTLYHSGMSADVGTLVQALIAEDGLERVALAGFSMGGNLVLKLAGEWGRGSPPQVRAVAAVSPAMDLGPSAQALHERMNRLYEWRFLWGLRRRVRRKARLFPGRYDLRYLRGLWTLRDFDDQITARYCGFGSAEDYYERASSSRVLQDIALPTLVMHALDDPFIRVLPATRAKLLANPNIRYLETEHGGHCAFVADALDYDGRWAERQVVEFVRDRASQAWAR